MTTDRPLAGHVALVCGASRGIGRATVLALAEAGASVWPLARDGRALTELAATLPGEGHLPLVGDLGEPEPILAELSRRLAEHRVTVLVNNVAGPPPGPLLTAPPEALLATFQLHLLSAHRLVQLLVPGMRAAGYGRIVNVISTSVKEPLRGLGVSNTVRGAMAAWAKTLAGELGPFGITVNNVLPGYTATDRLAQIIARRQADSGQQREAIEAEMLAHVPAGRFADPRETAAAIAFLASPQAGYVNGINLPVDGGRTLSL